MTIQLSECKEHLKDVYKWIIDDVIKDDTVGLIVTNYHDWFDKYAAKWVNQNGKQCEEIGCYYSDEVSIVDSVSIIGPFPKHYNDVSWANMICDTVKLNKNYPEIKTETLQVASIVYKISSCLIGTNMYPIQRNDTCTLVYIPYSQQLIISYKGVYMSRNRISSYKKWWSNKYKTSTLEK